MNHCGCTLTQQARMALIKRNIEIRSGWRFIFAACSFDTGSGSDDDAVWRSALLRAAPADIKLKRFSISRGVLAVCVFRIRAKKRARWKGAHPRCGAVK